MVFKIDVASILSSINDYKDILFKFNYNEETGTIILSDLEDLIKLQMLIGHSLMVYNHTLSIYDNCIE